MQGAAHLGRAAAQAQAGRQAGHQGGHQGGHVAIHQAVVLHLEAVDLHLEAVARPSSAAVALALQCPEPAVACSAAPCRRVPAAADLRRVLAVAAKRARQAAAAPQAPVVEVLRLVEAAVALTSLSEVACATEHRRAMRRGGADVGRVTRSRAFPGRPPCKLVGPRVPAIPLHGVICTSAHVTRRSGASQCTRCGARLRWVRPQKCVTSCQLLVASRVVGAVNARNMF